MNLTDYGSVADWVAGLGTLLAIIAALWIAGIQQRDARKAREAEALAFHAQNQKIVAEAIRLATQIEQHCEMMLSDRDALKQPSDPSEGNLPDARFLAARGFFLLHEIEGLRQQVIALQAFGVNDARAHIEIGRMAYEATIDFPRNIDHRRVSTSEIMRVSHDMRKRAEALSQVASASSSPIQV